MLTKTLISIGIGIAIDLSPLRNSKIVRNATACLFLGGRALKLVKNR